MLDTDLLSQLQVALMEAPLGPDGGVTWASGLWTQAEVLHRLNERSNRLIKVTALLCGEAAPIPVTAGVSRYTLPQDWLRSLDYYWVGQDGTTRALVRSDSFEADHGHSAWEYTPGTPLVYMDEEAPLLSVVIGPVPNVSGVLILLYVPQGAVMDGSGQPITVPEDFASGPLFGTLADLLGKDGRGADPSRAAYAEMRFGLCVDVAAILLAGQV